MDVLERFAGAWTLRRVIEDAAAGETWRFEGRAVFAPDAEGLAYVETGRLSGPGETSFEAERRYLWRPAGSEIAIFFADGRPFHRFDPLSGDMETPHLCGADLYRVTYTLDLPGAFTQIWRVTGPRKDAHITSHFTRR